MGEYRKEGRELDTEILASLFGKTPEQWHMCYELDMLTGEWPPVPPMFSTLIDYGMRVVERMRANGWRCTMEMLAHGESPYVFVAFHTRKQTPAEGYHALAKTLSLAICLAALRVLEATTPAKASVEQTESPAPLSPEDMTDG